MKELGDSLDVGKKAGWGMRLHRLKFDHALGERVVSSAGSLGRSGCGVAGGMFPTAAKESLVSSTVLTQAFSFFSRSFFCPSFDAKPEGMYTPLRPFPALEKYPQHHTSVITAVMFVFVPPLSFTGLITLSET